MDLRHREEHLRLRESFLAFVDRELRPLEADRLAPDGEVPSELRRAVRQRSAAAGFYAPDFPVELGGAELSQLGMVLLRETAEATGCRLASHAVYGPEGPNGILLTGTPAQRRRYLAPLVRAEKTRCLALTEPQAGSDAQQLTTRAVRDGDDWVLDGTKRFISNADEADFAIVFAVTDPDKLAQGGITAFVIERGTPGLEVGPAQRGLSDEVVFDLVLDHCRIPTGQIVGGPDNLGLGFLAAMEYLALGRLAVAATCNGLAELAVRLGTEHAKARHAFGQPIGRHQYVQDHLVESMVALRAAKLLTYEAAWKFDQGEDAIADASAAKLFASETANRIVDRILQVHGALGWSRASPLERSYRLARTLRIVEGTSEIQKLVIARTAGL